MIIFTPKRWTGMAVMSALAVGSFAGGAANSPASATADLQDISSVSPVHPTPLSPQAAAPDDRSQSSPADDPPEHEPLLRRVHRPGRGGPQWIGLHEIMRPAGASTCVGAPDGSYVEWQTVAGSLVLGHRATCNGGHPYFTDWLLVEGQIAWIPKIAVTVDDELSLAMTQGPQDVIVKLTN